MLKWFTTDFVKCGQSKHKFNNEPVMKVKLDAAPVYVLLNLLRFMKVFLSASIVTPEQQKPIEKVAEEHMIFNVS